MSAETKYKIVNGTHYHHETPDELIAALELARTCKLRVRMSLGNKDTGRDGEPRESLEWEIRRDGETYFRFATRQDAERFSRKLGVEMSFSEGA